MKGRLPPLLLALPLLLPGIANAAPRTDTVLVNVAALGFGIGEVRWEHLVTTHTSAALFGGAGTGTTLAGFQDVWLAEAGLHVRAYFAGGFDEGLALAVEGAYLQMLGDGALDRNGWAISPRLVYKLTFMRGLTAELQVGGASVLRRVRPVGSSRMQARTEGQAVIALGLGWSF